MADIIKPKILKGFRDFLPEQEIQRKKIRNILENKFESFGFLPIDTPSLEYSEVLLGKGGGETDKQVYRFADNGKRDVSMRFDLTVPFARFMALNRNDLYLPFKRYHISKVWRGENTQRGRYREFTQCDFDIVGTDSASADFEILLLMARSMEALGVNNYKIHLSNRAIFNRFLKYIKADKFSVEIMRTVDKIKKIGEEKVISILTEYINETDAKKILDYIKPESSFEKTLSKITKLAGGSEEDTKRLEDIYKMIKSLDLEKYYELDPSITRGLDYYTGIVYETFLTDIPEIGSVCSGGRYNNLASLYTKEDLPGVGSSIGLDRLIAALEALGKFDTGKASTQVLILNLNPELLGHYHLMADKIRQNGISCEIYPENKKFKNQFAYAEKKEIPLAIICGDEEKSKSCVNIKNLDKRESIENIKEKNIIAELKKLI